MHRLTQRLRIVLPGSIYPVEIPAGAEVSGRAEEVARKLGILEEVETIAASPQKKRGRPKKTSE